MKSRRINSCICVRSARLESHADTPASHQMIICPASQIAWRQPFFEKQDAKDRGEDRYQLG